MTQAIQEKPSLRLIKEGYQTEIHVCGYLRTKKKKKIEKFEKSRPVFELCE